MTDQDRDTFPANRASRRPEQAPGMKGEVPPAGSERRRYHRIPANLGLLVRILDPQAGEPEPRETTSTINVSPGDAFFNSAQGDRLRIGTDLALHIELPVDTPNLFAAKHLEVTGRIVRVGPPDPDDPSRRGVAVRFLNTPRFANDLG